MGLCASSFQGLPLTGGTIAGSLVVTGSIQGQSGGMGLSAGELDVKTPGQGVAVAEGSNAKQGTATLTAGTVTVANTSVTASSRIFLTCQSLGTVSTPSALCVSSRTAGNVVHDPRVPGHRHIRDRLRDIRARLMAFQDLGSRRADSRHF